MEDDFPAIETRPGEEASYRIQRQVAEWVSYQLSKQGKTQSWLAEKMDKKQPYISRILAEGGTNITVDTAGELEAALGVPVLETPPEFEFRAIYDNNYWYELSAKRTLRRFQYGFGVTSAVFIMGFALPAQKQPIGIESGTYFQIPDNPRVEQRLGINV